VVKWIPGDMNEKDTTIHTRFSLFAAHNDFSELLRGEYPSSAGGLEMLVELLCGEYPSSAGGLEMLVELLCGEYPSSAGGLEMLVDSTKSRLPA